MVNHITAYAHGAPNSFVRRVQHNPGIAADLLRTLEAIVNEADTNPFAAIGQVIEHGARKNARELIAEAKKTNWQEAGV